MNIDAIRKGNRERKQASRAKRKRFDMKVIEVSLSARQRDTLNHVCHVRGGCDGPYSHQEYIAALIDADARKLAHQVAALGPCDHCRSPLPGGCDGVFKGQVECFHHTRARALRVTGHTVNKESSK